MIDWNGKKLCENCLEECEGEECAYCEKSVPESGVPTGCLPAKTVLQERYIIGRVLGRGGFGITYLAFDMIEKCRVAIKEYFPDTLVYRQPGEARVSTYTDLEKGESFRTGLEKFYSEAQTMAQFNGHPNIVNVKRFFYANETAYYVMEYLDGINLKQYVAQQENRVSFEHMLQLLLPVMNVMELMHEKNMLHRDVSPDNIFIVNDGTVKLLDFGSARQVLSEQSNSLSVILKVGYTPVEQYQSHGKQGPWTDVYALAATMYYCLTGIAPVSSMDRVEEDSLKKISELRHDMGQKTDDVFAKAMAVRSANRYQSIGEFRAALLAVGEDETTKKKKVKWVFLLAVLLCLAGSIFALSQLAGRKQTDGKVYPDAGISELPEVTKEPTPTLTSTPTPIPASTVTPEPTSTPTPEPTNIPAPEYPKALLHFYRGYIEETEVIWEGKGWGHSPTDWSAVCYNYADDSTVEIPVEMIEIGDGYVWFKDGFLETLEPSVYEITLKVWGFPNGLSNTVSVVLEVHEENVIPENEDGRPINNSRYVPASTKHYGITVPVNNQAMVRFTGAWVSIDGGLSFDKLDESNYKIVADGRVMMIDKRYFGKYDGVEDFTILYFFDDGTCEYYQLYFFY